MTETIKKETSFWMVYVDGGNSPNYRHQNFASAKAEAERLAGKLKPQKVYVLKTIGVAEVPIPPVEWNFITAKPRAAKDAEQVPF